MASGPHADCYWPFFFQAEDGIRDLTVTGVQTCALPICSARRPTPRSPTRSPGTVGRSVCSSCRRGKVRAEGILDRFEATGVVVKIAEILGVEVGGSNPLTPTDSQMLDSQLGYRAFLLRQAFPNW